VVETWKQVQKLQGGRSDGQDGWVKLTSLENKPERKIVFSADPRQLMLMGHLRRGKNSTVVVYAKMLFQYCVKKEYYFLYSLLITHVIPCFGKWELHSHAWDVPL